MNSQGRTSINQNVIISPKYIAEVHSVNYLKQLPHKIILQFLSFSFCFSNVTDIVIHQVPSNVPIQKGFQL